jgi:NAD(P)-dependent dehydrogenase (short-subunit alcohol dehydrogenase family)
MLELNDKIALVTGGNSGIGLACAERFVALGANVVITGRSVDKAQEALERLGRRASFLPCDLRDGDQIRALFEQIRQQHGRLDIAVNNAGVEGKSFTKLVEYPEEIWDEVIQVNLKAVWLCMKGEIELMLRAGSGAIVNVSSLAGLKASLSGGAAYTASKHGVVGLTRSAAKEYAANRIRVNCVCPALIRTPMAEAVIPEGLDELGAKHHPVGRIGEPEDVASAVAWLCSDVSSFLTGISVPVDGGLLS